MFFLQKKNCGFFFFTIISIYIYVFYISAFYKSLFRVPTALPFLYITLYNMSNFNLFYKKTVKEPEVEPEPEPEPEPVKKNTGAGAGARAGKKKSLLGVMCHL